MDGAIVKLKNIVIATVLAGLTHAASAAPATLVQLVSHDGETITLQLTKQELRGSNFELWVQNTNGTYDVITPVAERSYIGTVDEYPGAVASGIQDDSGMFRGSVVFDRGKTWYIQGSAVTRVRGDWMSTPTVPTWGHLIPGQAGTDMWGFEIGVDARYEYFDVRGGGSIAETFALVEENVAMMRALYMRDALLRPSLGRVVIRTDAAQCPYAGLTGGTYLDALLNEWNNNHTDTNPDTVQGITTDSVGGGLAWVGVIGTGSKYAVNDSYGSDGNWEIYARHEMGHNWGLGHGDGGIPEPGTINSWNDFCRMSGPEVRIMLDHRDSRSAGVLENEGGYTAASLPPYAGIDSGTFAQGVDSQLVFNVVANDHDANGDSLSILSFDATSAKGGTVTQQGQNLVYTAPGAYLGADSFFYTISDSSGQTATGAVAINVQLSNVIHLYLPLDETSGTNVTDYSVFANTGTVSTNLSALSVAGQYANAVNFDGVDDHAWVSDMDLSSDKVTITAWIKPAASQIQFSGIVFDRSSRASGLNIHSDGALRYHWNDQAATYNWNSGLVPPADAWTFVALVVEPTKATMYMNTGAGFQSAENNTAHAAASFGTTYIGRDPGNSRFYKGVIDDVRIYNGALTLAALQDVRDGETAVSPSPFDGAFDVQSPEVSWTPSSGALSYEVYLGTNQAAVSSATTASSEYQGSTNATEWVFDLQPDATYYWRVDAVTASATIPGAVWSFATAGEILEYGLVAHWKLDDGSGLTAADSSIHSNTGTLNGPAWTTGVDNGALSFDGVDDSVTFGTGPALSGPTDFTVSAWIKTSAGTEQVILQQRDGGGAGYNGQYVFRVMANGTVHFYVYRDGGYQFSFGTTATVNDGQWHMVSAVRDGEDGHIYIDGNPAPAASASGAIRDLNAGIGVGMGRDIRDNNKSFSGLIDEARIYNQAKSGQDLADRYIQTIGMVPIDVQNHSFELPNTAKQTNWESVPGWSSDSVAADSGVESGADATEGSWSGFLWSADPSVWNLTDHVIAAGESYTLRVDAQNTGGGSSLRIMLYYDTAGSRVTLATLDAVLSDGMQEFALPFNADDVPASVGNQIGVELDNVAGGWVGFDNIRLTRVLSVVDSDGDGMPNDWEAANGLNPNVDDRTGNPDGDAYDNWAEYVTDTNPQDGGSYQTFSVEPAPGTGEPTLRFSTSTGRNYVVQYRDSLTSGSWQDLGPVSPGTGTEMTVSDSAGIPNRYYRLRVELP